MRHALLILLTAATLCCHAQTQKELRDSLTAAARELSFRPDSLDLRIKKAAWNLQLEQWDYAVEEYDYVLKMDKCNIAAIYYSAYA